MQYSWLRSFHWAAECGTISEAASQLNVAPSAISRQIKDLELRYSVKLFERNANRIVLTPIGFSLKRKTNKLFSAEQSVRALLEKTKNRGLTTLNIGTENIVDLLPVMTHLDLGINKNLIRLFDDNYKTLKRMFFDDKIDALISHEISNSEFRDMDEAPMKSRIKTDRLQFIQSADKPLIKAKSMPLRELLSKTPIISRTNGSFTRDQQDLICERLGVEANIICEMSNREALLHTVAEGHGVGLVFSESSSLIHGLTAIPYDHDDTVGDLLSKDIFLYCRDSMKTHPIIAKLITMLQPKPN